MKNGIVDVGGGLRGIYAAGVLDYCMDQNIRFDLGKPYYDGALGDPVPVEKAFQLGCDRVVVILTKPEHELRSPERDEKLAVHIRKKYPFAAEKLCLRAQQYNESVAHAKEYARQGKVLIVSPDDTCGIDTLKKDKESLKRLYEKGYKDGQKIEKFCYIGA